MNKTMLGGGNNIDTTVHALLIRDGPTCACARRADVYNVHSLKWKEFGEQFNPTFAVRNTCLTAAVGLPRTLDSLFDSGGQPCLIIFKNRFPLLGCHRSKICKISPAVSQFPKQSDSGSLILFLPKCICKTENEIKYKCPLHSPITSICFLTVFFHEML